MRRLEPRWLVLLAAFALAGAIVIPQSLANPPARAQETDAAASQPLRESLIQAILQDLPPAPARIQMLDITLQPGARVPTYTRPGPEFSYIESGILTVRVEGEVVIAQAPIAGTPQPPRVPPVGQEFELGPRDQIVYPAGVPFTIENRTSDPVSIISVNIVPAGSERPPDLAWVGGTPVPDALAGVQIDLLGSAFAPGWPEPPFAIILDRLVLPTGVGIPARGGPVILAVETGYFGFSLVDGQFQLSRQNNVLGVATPGTAYLLYPGDAVFFPGGMNEVPRNESDGLLVLLRLSVLNASGLVPAAAGTPQAGTDAPATTQAPAAATLAPTQAAPAPTEAAAPAGATTGVITQAGVLLRTTPSAAGEVVAELNQGRAVIITGEAVEGDGLQWYPIQAADDPAVTGYVVIDFVELAP